MSPGMHVPRRSHTTKIRMDRTDTMSMSGGARFVAAGDNPQLLTTSRGAMCHTNLIQNTTKGRNLMRYNTRNLLITVLGITPSTLSSKPTIGVGITATTRESAGTHLNATSDGNANRLMAKIRDGERTTMNQ